MRVITFRGVLVFVVSALVLPVQAPRALAAPGPDLVLDWAPDNHCEASFAPIRVVKGFLQWGAAQICRGASVYTQYLRVELYRELDPDEERSSVYVANSPLEQRFNKSSTFDQTLPCESEAVRGYHMLVWSFADDERQFTRGESATVDLPCEVDS